MERNVSVVLIYVFQVAELLRNLAMIYLCDSDAVSENVIELIHNTGSLTPLLLSKYCKEVY